MNITIGTGRRITIPADLFRQTNFKEGDTLDLQFVDNKFILTAVQPDCVTNESNTSVDDKSEKINVDSSNKKVNSNKKVSTTQNRFTRKIVSNLEEGSKFSTKYYSPCELIIRTKNRYLREFCEDCKGELLKQGYEDNGKCKYIDRIEEPKEQKKPETVEQVHEKPECNIINEQQKRVKMEPNVNKTHENKPKILDEIKNNVNKVKTKIDKEIDDLTSQDKKFLKEKGKKTIQPVRFSKGHIKCTDCGELHNTGFYIDGKFYCKKCTITDFRCYLDIYRKVNKE